MRGFFVIEGEKVIGELLAAHYPLLEIYATAAWFNAAPRTAAVARSVQLITPEEMARASHFPTPASILAVGKITRPSLVHGTLNHGLTLALDGIQDPGNVGTLLRVADWYGLDRVVLSPDSADLFPRKLLTRVWARSRG